MVDHTSSEAPHLRLHSPSKIIRQKPCVLKLPTVTKGLGEVPNDTERQ